MGIFADMNLLRLINYCRYMTTTDHILYFKYLLKAKSDSHNKQSKIIRLINAL